MEGSPSVMRVCGFGHQGVTLTLHIWCEDQFLNMATVEQDRIIHNATHRTHLPNAPKIG